MVMEIPRLLRHIHNCKLVSSLPKHKKVAYPGIGKVDGRGQSAGYWPWGTQKRASELRIPGGVTWGTYTPRFVPQRLVAAVPPDSTTQR